MSILLYFTIEHNAQDYQRNSLTLFTYFD